MGNISDMRPVLNRAALHIAPDPDGAVNINMALVPLDASEYSDDWTSVLIGHPIFSLPSDTDQSKQLELSTNSLPDFTQLEPCHDSPSTSGRRQAMVLKDADLIVAIEKEIRVTSLGDTKLGRVMSKSYKARVNIKPYHSTLTRGFRFYIHPIFNLTYANYP